MIEKLDLVVTLVGTYLYGRDQPSKEVVAWAWLRRGD